MIRGTGPAIYGPTSQATAHYPANVRLQIEDWLDYQREATADNQARGAVELAALYRNIGIPQPNASQPATAPPATQLPAPPPPAAPPSENFLSNIPTWAKWAAGAGIGLLFLRK